MNKSDLANAITAQSLAPGQNTVTLEPGYIAGMPPVSFMATISPFGQLPTRGNSEIVEVTEVNGDTLTLERAQKDTTAKSFPAGSIVTNAIYVDDLVPAKGGYSLEEIDTGDTWIDGRTMYRKTFNMGGLKNAGIVKVPHNIDKLDLVIAVRGFAKEYSIGATINLPHAADQQAYTVTVYADNTSVNIQTYANQTGYTTAYVTLWYVKRP